MAKKLTFSERTGHRQPRIELQKDRMSRELRTRLWNISYENLFSILSPTNGLGGLSFLGLSESQRILCTTLWRDHFKWPIDDVPPEAPDALGKIRKYFFGCDWFDVYDLLEFVVVLVSSPEDQTRRFVEQTNRVLEEECSAWRFVGGELVPITSDEEIKEIENAMNVSSPLKTVSNHISTALGFLSDRQNPDYRNSIKESISAVEAISKIVCDIPDATLGRALNAIEKQSQVEMHSDLKEAFKKLYSWTSDAEGIRHALMDETNLGQEDAQFMLVACSAFVNYLKVKASKAGLI